MRKRYLFTIVVLSISIAILYIYISKFFYTPVRVEPPEEPSVSVETKKEDVSIPSTFTPKEDLGLNLKLLGIVLAEDPSRNLAIIKNTASGEGGFYYIGDVVDIWNILDISLDKVVLQKKGEKEKFILSLESSDKEISKGDSIPLAEEVFQGEYYVNRQRLKEKMSNINTIVQEVKVFPFIRDGKIEGFQLNNLAEDGIGQQLGLKNGDIIKAVNNSPLDSLKKPFELYTQLKKLDAIQVDIERGGEEISVIYRIK